MKLKLLTTITIACLLAGCKPDPTLGKSIDRLAASCWTNGAMWGAQAVIEFSHEGKTKFTLGEAADEAAKLKAAANSTIIN